MIQEPYIVRITSIAVMPKGNPLFCEDCTNISIVDEAAGEFLEIQQQFDPGKMDLKPQAIYVTNDQWPALKKAVEQMLEEIKKHEA